MKLSHSKLEKFKSCPKLYDYHYNQKLRPVLQSSALFFGLAIGETWQMMILDKKIELTDEEKKIVGSEPYKFFDERMQSIDINGKTFELETCIYARYFKGDYQEHLLTDEDWTKINNFKKENDIVDDVTFDQLYKFYNIEQLEENELKLINLYFYLSLKRIGYALIEAFDKEIYPRFNRVFRIEFPISIKNDDGDEIIGFGDVDAEFLDEHGVMERTILDNKTSSAKYKASAVIDKVQLGYYEYSEEIGKQGYIVGIKRIPVRSKKANIQVITGKIPEVRQEEIIAEADEILREIKECEENNHYPENIHDGCKVFGRTCSYFKICQEGEEKDKDLYKSEGR